MPTKVNGIRKPGGRSAAKAAKRFRNEQNERARANRVRRARWNLFVVMAGQR